MVSGDSRDSRTKRQKLKDMANQTASPYEAEVAKKKLQDLGPEPERHQPELVINFRFEVRNDGFDIFRNWNYFVSGFGEY